MLHPHRIAVKLGRSVMPLLVTWLWVETSWPLPVPLPLPTHIVTDRQPLLYTQASAPARCPGALLTLRTIQLLPRTFLHIRSAAGTIPAAYNGSFLFLFG